jgi:hypothetical protein
MALELGIACFHHPLDAVRFVPASVRLVTINLGGNRVFGIRKNGRPANAGADDPRGPR